MRPGALAIGLGAGLAAAAAVTAPGPRRQAGACLAETARLQPAVPGATPRLAGNLLVANQASGTATLVALATGAVTTLELGADDPHDAAISPDGRWGVVSDFGERSARGFLGNRFFVVDIRAKRIARVVETGTLRGLHDVAFRPGFPARALITAQTSRRIIEVDAPTGSIVGSTETRGERSHLVAVTSDGGTAFTTNEGSATISRIDLSARRFVRAFPASDDVEGIAVTGDGKELWVGENRLGAVRVLDAATGTVRASFPGFRFPNRLATTRDGRRVIVSDPGCDAIVVADAAARKIVSVIRTAGTVLVGDVLPDGRTAFAAMPDARQVVALDLDSGRILARYPTGRTPDGLGWAPAP